MPPLARRNLFHDKVRLIVTVTGIVFAVVLIVVELGLFVGFTETTSSLIDHSGADLWVTSQACALRRAWRSFQRAQAVPGARRAGREGSAKAEYPMDRLEARRRPAGIGADRGYQSGFQHGAAMEPGAGHGGRFEAARCHDHGRNLQRETGRPSHRRNLRDPRTSRPGGRIHPWHSQLHHFSVCVHDFQERAGIRFTIPDDQTIFILVKTAPGARHRAGTPRDSGAM